MKLKRRDRLALIVLLVGAVALAIDQLVLPAPTIVQAAEAGPDDLVTAPLDPFALFKEPGAPTTCPALDEIQDVFDRARLPGLGGARPQATQAAAAEHSCIVFENQHRLQATILGPQPRALVDGRKLALGDMLDGFRLSAVRDAEAVFVSDAGTVLLRVPRRSRNP